MKGILKVDGMNQIKDSVCFCYKAAKRAGGMNTGCDEDAELTEEEQKCPEMTGNGERP